jgi:hypothetical protein
MPTKEEIDEEIERDRDTVKRVHVNFAMSTYKILEEIASRKNLTISEALRQSILLTDYIEKATLVENAKVYIDRGKGLNELVIR